MSFANLPVVCHLMKGATPDIRLEDISTLLLREYLVKVGSKLASEINIRPLQEILEQMDLFVPEGKPYAEKCGCHDVL